MFIWGVCVDWLGTVTSIKSSCIVVYLGGGRVCVDWLGTVTSIKSSWIVVYLGGYALTGLGQSLQ